MQCEKKADLLAEHEGVSESTAAAPNIMALIRVGAVIIQTLIQKSIQYQDYMEEICISQQLDSLIQLCLVWDRYLKDNIKSYTRKRRRRWSKKKNQEFKVSPNWEGIFLLVNENKTFIY